MDQVLSNPEQMAKIMELAKSFSGAEPSQAPPPPPEREDIPTEKLMGMIGTVLKDMGTGNDSKAALLSSMRPFLREERYLSLQKAMRLAKLARIARSAMSELGGDSLV